MNITESLKNWMKEMGFDGEMPNDFSSFCGPSNAFLWEEVITQIRPRQEIKHIRQNLVINRLENKFDSFPMKEIEVYERKQTLRAKVQLLENEIVEKKEKLQYILNSNKTNFLHIRNLKQKIQENEEKIFICELKSDDLKDNIDYLQEHLQEIKYNSPVEEERNSDDIKEILSKCAEKLSKHANKLTIDKLDTTPMNLSIQSTINQSDFLTPLLQRKTSTAIKPKKPRESLGLLPNDCISEIDEIDDEIFLTSVSIELQSESKLLSISKTSENHFDNLFKQTLINQPLKELLHSANKNQIVTVWKIIMDSLFVDAKKNICQFSLNDDYRDKEVVNENGLMELYLEHVKNEINFRKNTTTLKKLENTMNDLRVKYNIQLNTVDNIKTKFNLEYLKNEFIKLENVAGKYSENNALKMKLTKINSNYATFVSQIESWKNYTNKLFDLIKANSEKIETSLQNVLYCMCYTSWAEDLSENRFSKEINLFEKLPLHSQMSNLHCTSHIIPSYIDLNQKELSMIANITERPSAPIESILINILHMKQKIKKFKEIPQPLESIAEKSIQLDLEDENIDKVLNQVEEYLHSNTVRKIKQCPSLTEKTVDFWLQAPVREFMPECVQINGHSYKYYENILKQQTGF